VKNIQNIDLQRTDEPRYYTVFQPYPLNANWEVREDYIAFARWIAQCIGTESFYALYYKPKVRMKIARLA